MKIRSVETALRADVSQNVPNGVDALGIFDNLVQPIFPFPVENLSIILSFSEMEGPTMYQIRVNAPNDDLISKGDFGVLPDQFGYGRKVVNLGGILITERGKYTVDIFEIGADNKLKFLKTKRLFNADYPPQREISDAEKEAILADEKLIRMVKTEFKPFEFVEDESVKPIKLQISLDNSVPVEEGYIAFPEDDTIEIKGKKFDLTGMRRHVEWMFGRPIPRAEEETPNEEKEEENIFNDILVNYKNRVQKKEEKKIRPIEEYEEQKIVISKQRQDEEFVYKVDVRVSEAKVEEDKKKYNSENEDRQKEEMVSAEEQVRNNVSEITPLEVNTLSIPKRVVEKEIKTSDKKINSVDLTLLSYGGRVFDTYIMLYNDEDMYIIDQHAAHERILYERFLREFYSNSIVQQQLLIPQNVVIPVNLVDYSQSIIEEASSFGFECDLFGDNIILVRAIPDFLDMEASLRFLDEVFNIYLEEKLSLELIKDKIATKACKAAIKGNDTSIKEEEIEKIIYDLEHCENKFACPHGRPVITRLSKYEMEKFFKRIL